LAHRTDADGIFMGRGEHSKLGQLFYGSVSHYVLLNAKTSVIISPSGSGESNDQSDSDVDYRASRMDK
jgi:nucleotide-binding universal stress UspA family protein